MSPTRFAFLTSAPDPFLAVDGELRVVFANTAAGAFFAVDAAALTGRPLAATLPMLARGEIEQALRAAVRSRLPADFEAPIADGHRHVAVRIVPGDDLVLLYLHDLTPALRHGAAAEEAAALLRGILEGSDDIVAVLGSDYRFRAFNPPFARAFRQVYGVALREGDDLQAVLADQPGELGRLRQLWDAPLRGERLTLVAEFGHPELGRRIYENRLSPIVDRAGVVIGALNIAIDVTEREAAEEALRASEEKFRLLTMATPVGVYMLDAEGRVTFINPRIETMLGDAAERLLGRGWASHVHEDDVESVRAHLQRSLQTPAPTSLEFRMRHSNGTALDVQSFSTPLLDDDGRITGRVGVLEDVTERRRAAERQRQLDEQLQQAQKLESLGVLAGGIAHDFNNLLVGILGNASIALGELASGDKAAAAVHDIERAARRAADLTRQLLAYSGRGRFVVAPTDVSHVVEEMAGLLRTAVPRQIDLRMRLTPGLPAVEGDATQLRQVVMNLITNAADAIGEAHGEITLRTGLQDLTADYLRAAIAGEGASPGRHVFIEVADTGCGMDAATLTRIFDPFFTTKFAGRGLGLAATLGIVRGHRGALRVYSEPGRGTTFRILLPALEEPAPAVAPTAVAIDAWTGHGTVLVVDDDPAVARVATVMLERKGFEALVAPDGEVALALYAEHRARIRLVVLDLTMPRMGGEETCRRLRQLDPAVRVLLTSGYNEQDVAHAFNGKGLAGFLAKPFSAPDFYSALRAALGE